ncbi:hypothetical protein IDJ75_18310 [Mucilaginibacter rigui]|uniref:Uncharacterized protein n=1 Tax=Mucilaginibacter rigui TaxID=534635 RepID=A0ABR7X9J9_9SPHI|nr:hypothetical protein [Mucilaginibacter rigui]MBD1387248.1 hypothetical protein [Mucilaginibacter rigui]
MKNTFLLSCALLLTCLKVTAQENISLRDVASYIGKEVTVNPQVFDFDSKKDYVYLYFGERYPNQKLTVIIKRPVKVKLPILLGQEIASFTGAITQYSGKPDSSANYGIDEIKKEAEKDKQLLIGGKEMTGHIGYTPHNHTVNLQGKLVMLITDQKQISKKTKRAAMSLY